MRLSQKRTYVHRLISLEHCWALSLRRSPRVYIATFQALSSRSLADLTSLAQTIANLTTVLQTQTELANRTSHLLEEQNRRLSLSGSSWLGWVAAVAWRVVGRGVLGMWGGITTSNNNAIELEGSYRE